MKKMMSINVKPIFTAGIFLVSLFIAWFLCESILKYFFLVPATDYYGDLFGKKLPPFKIIKSDAHIFNNNREGTGPKNLKTISTTIGTTVTVGDLWGIFREDPILGYAPKEGVKSEYGWWQTDELGSRVSSDKNIHPVHVRDEYLSIAVFGDSYTQGSRLPMQETWAYYFNSIYSGEMGVANFGVDGYSMAQSYLRYNMLKNKILDKDIIMLVFVPSADLYRDINTLRALRDWPVYSIMPRFILSGDKIKVIPSPYENSKEVILQNHNMVSNTLLNHLRSYDRYYIKEKYENIPIVGESILYKLIMENIYTRKINFVENNLFSLTYEALKVSKRIFISMCKDANNSGKRFVIIFLPEATDITKYKHDKTFRNKWDDAVGFLNIENAYCIDLMKDFVRIKKDDFDTGYTGDHYGPIVNKLMAQFIGGRMSSMDN